MHTAARTPLLLSLCLLLPACSLREHIARVSGEVEAQYADLRTWEELPIRTISWEQAVAMMRRNNLELQKSQIAIDKAERETLSVYTDMIPQVTYYGYFNKSLRELTNTLNQDDVNYNVNITFSLPSLTQLPYRVYAAQAGAFSAMKAKEGKERELVSKLYLAVRKRELAGRRQALAERKAAEPAADGSAPAPTDLQAGNSEAEYWKSTADLIGDSSARWQILPESMPRVTRGQYLDRLDTLDPLIVCKFALQLERARMQQYSVALRYLPTINTGLYSPSLFSSTGGTYSGTFLDADDTHLNLSLGYSLDTQLRTWNSYMDSKEAYEMARKEVRAELMDHKTKVKLLRQSMAEYDTWCSYMRKRMDYLRNSPAATAAEYLEQNKALLSMEEELLNQEERAIDSEAALILEYGMPQ